jgi:hypothetical protein
VISPLRDYLNKNHLQIKDGGGAGRRVLVAIKASRDYYSKNKSMVGGKLNLADLYGFYYPSASGFTVLRYAILRAFKIISSNLSIICSFGKRLTISTTSSETLTRLLTFA